MRKVALIQPIVAAGKSLGIFKAPESIMALAGQLKMLGWVVRMFHASFGQELMSELSEFAPDYVGISMMTPNFPEGLKIVKALKASKPEMPVILGGWHASGCVQAHLLGQESESLKELLNENSPFDFVIAGEGENALATLLAQLEAGQTVESKNGVSFFRKGMMQVSPRAEKIMQLDKLAMPSWEGLDVDKYRDKRNGNLDLSVHFNRACRFSCSYCATSVLYGKGVRTRSAAKSVEYIKFLIEAYHPQVITFTDEDFFANMKWVEDVVELLLQENLYENCGIEFDTFASINDLYLLRKSGKGDFLDLMYQAGFRSFTIGIESFNPAVLLSYNKEQMIVSTMDDEVKRSYLLASSETRKEILLKTHLLRASEAVEFAQEHGIMIIGDYIVGNPGESEKEVRSGFELFKNINGLIISYIPVFTPFPGTALWDEAYHAGLLARNSEGAIAWEKFDASAGALSLGYDIEALRNELEIEFYTSVRYAKDMLATIEKKPGIKKFFVDRFTFLAKTFPGDKRVQAQLMLLGH